VVQYVFLAALDGLAAFQHHSSLRTRMVGIAHHKIDRARVASRTIGPGRSAPA
jgi:hypothetical protein